MIITAFKVTISKVVSVLLDLLTSDDTVLFQWQLERLEQLKVIVQLLD